MGFLALLSAALSVAILSPQISGYCFKGDSQIPKCGTDGYQSGDCCIAKQYWCNASAQTVPNCDSTDHLRYENCVQITETTDKYEYLFTGISTDWETAELFCNSKGYNLMYFTSKEEPMWLTKKLSERFDFQGENVDSKNYADPLHRLCWIQKVPLKFWTGILFDEWFSQWTTTAGEKLWENALLRGDGSYTTLGVFVELLQLKQTTNQGSLRIYLDAKSSEFVATSVDRSSSQGYPNILCKRAIVDESDSATGKPAGPRMWSTLFPPPTQECLTGYTCLNSSKCLKGLQYGEDSDLLDFRKDCPLGDDEYLDTLQSMRHRANSSDRQYVFYPIARQMHEVIHLCAANGLTMPSVHSQEDLDILRRLPTIFQDNRTDFEFIRYSNFWLQESWYVPLGIEGKRYLDGSFVPEDMFHFDNNENRSIFDQPGLFAVNRDGLIVGSIKRKQTMLVVCQDGVYRGRTADLPAGTITIFVSIFISFAMKSVTV